MTDAATRAAAAQRLLDEPLLQEAFANVRGAAIEAWIATKTADASAREFAWLTVKAVDRIAVELQSVVDTGKIAAARIQAPVR